jgi:hypothetical protein
MSEEVVEIFFGGRMKVDRKSKIVEPIRSAPPSALLSKRQKRNFVFLKKEGEDGLKDFWFFRAELHVNRDR